MCQHCRQVIEKLAINIELLLHDLDSIAAIANRKKLSELDRLIICHSLLGLSRQQIANIFKLPDQKVRDRLTNNIYPRLSDLMRVEQEEIAGNWVKIINFLLDPEKGYKLNPAPQLNSDNFQGSFGRQIFLYPPNQEIVKYQIEGTNFYQQGLYYQAFQCFLIAWNQELKIYGIGNPEVLIYINNCLIEYKKSFLQGKGIKIYTLAVVVPFYHNQGHVAAEILRGISQIQLQVNLPSFDKISLGTEINLDDIRPNIFLTLICSQIALQILVVNDPNNLYTPYNQTAEKLADLAPQLNLIAIIGHYSSEMTKNALHFYTQKGLTLVNSSSTSNELSELSIGESLSFFRLTTPDNINAKKLANYLIEKVSNKPPQKVAVIYNQNSSYSISYRNSIKKYLEQHQDKFVFLEECNYISENYYQVQKYIENIREDNVDIIIIIPDGGIEPNSLDNAGLISRLNLNNCLIAGSATFYHDNVLHWIHEQNPCNATNQNNRTIIACIPWHWQSQENGCESSNLIAQSFCQIGAQFWGTENLTWRSATAFDSVLIILKVIEEYRSQASQALLTHMNQYFKEKKKQLKGVTGLIQFDKSGDRLHPPAEIVAVKWDENQQKWQWKI
ncbi:ABC-type branched-chain amino acid transport system, periplasmic component [Cylindrospermum stagnale PCC 7417]|uniref:ABC-type branched-chain amino acid transport system, periplasmic component n=1 Tax=Cylindrospermum stagnale PCC 7417 TaxID=56107 RepID=K9X2J7_9NOST|nr:ABC transporter substrate-binding protein [Cylindrospermum stagnale]AFZ26870.1 ABC-type branched-chain amino acid transport system, periplasmic component [Cylindrospermum stagnale PCC 7417]